MELKYDLADKEITYLNSSAFGNKSIQQLYLIRDLVLVPETPSDESLLDDEVLHIAQSIRILLNNEKSKNWGSYFLDCINKLIILKYTAESIFSQNEYEDSSVKITSNGKFKVKQTKDGFFFFLVSSKGEFLASSETYTSLSSCLNGINSVRSVINSEVEDQTQVNHRTINNPKFEIYIDKKSEYRFRLNARNGESLVCSEGYLTKEACEAALSCFKKNAAISEIVRV